MVDRGKLHANDDPQTDEGGAALQPRLGVSDARLLIAGI